MNRRSLFVALLGATTVKGGECISGEAVGNSTGGKQCIDGKWVHYKAWMADDVPRTRIGHADIHTPYTITNPPPVILLYNNTGVEPLGCPFNHDWEKVPNAFLSYTDPNLVDESSSGGSTPIPLSMGYMGPPVKPNPPIPGVSCCKRCGVLGMPKA